LSQNPFLNPVFNKAVADIEALGLIVSAVPSVNAIPYAVIGGRTNSRWWLVPLENNRVTVSGFALFQPLLASAKCMKAVAVLLSFVGLSRLWVRNKVYIAGESSLQQYFAFRAPLSFAYFTGTDSPHRKLAVQVMDTSGNIKGYAKVSDNPGVKALIQHEAATLDYLKTLNLQTTNIPNVLFSGEVSTNSLLVTDTLKTPLTPSTTTLTTLHQLFLQEIAEKTVTPHPIAVAQFLQDFRVRFHVIAASLDETWNRRFNNVLRMLETQSEISLSVCLSHGDFTPWNTFIASGKLYVFDWEYAEQGLPIGNDLVHFVINEPYVREQSAIIKIRSVIAFLSESWIGLDAQKAELILIIYLLSQTLRQIERSPNITGHVKTWDGDLICAEMLDGLLYAN